MTGIASHAGDCGVGERRHNALAQRIAPVEARNGHQWVGLAVIGWVEQG